MKKYYLRKIETTPEKIEISNYYKMCYMEKNREKLSKYSPELVKALLDTLVEFAPTETTWVSIWAITARLNEKLIPLTGQENKRMTGVKVGNLLRLLGFNERKRIRLATHCLVRQNILRIYRKEVG